MPSKVKALYPVFCRTAIRIFILLSGEYQCQDNPYYNGYEDLNAEDLEE